jgi:hypothetical protein
MHKWPYELQFWPHCNSEMDERITNKFGIEVMPLEPRPPWYFLVSYNQ